MQAVSGLPLSCDLSMVGKEIQLRQHLTDPQNEESLLIKERERERERGREREKGGEKKPGWEQSKDSLGRM